MSHLWTHLSLLLPPLLAGLIVLSTHVPLGQQVIQRGIIFIDLAIAQLAGLGVILVFSLQDSPAIWQVQAAAFAAALSGAGLLQLAERWFAQRMEAFIGLVFVLAISSALLVLAQDPQGGERLRTLLSGQLLWVSYNDLWLPALLAVVVLFLWRCAAIRRYPISFYALFAIAVTSAVQLVGVYLVFASLIIPALAQPKPTLIWHALLIGIAGYSAGLLGSLLTDLPTGPLTIWCLALIAGGYGLVFRRQQNSQE
ncbi:metal ABC transporter permease [Neptuniibacter sp. CAU 1671]|uniref:metal ABC transporter permease n=1 Tax=Neptuniibacter sp. CAU 1671 TaxID=3032593 RepID=UPI0023DAFF76|nr:metal ABC transporter permease [Neptuniibacter sp. CAU 1671]MDF2181638.1 metal ABC transporter permease [Neptuniibacter sp. CAU 1671]